MCCLAKIWFVKSYNDMRTELESRSFARSLSCWGACDFHTIAYVCRIKLLQPVFVSKEAVCGVWCTFSRVEYPRYKNKATCCPGQKIPFQFESACTVTGKNKRCRNKSNTKFLFELRDNTNFDFQTPRAAPMWSNWCNDRWSCINHIYEQLLKIRVEDMPSD